MIAGVTWVSGQGNPADGYTRGNLRRMIDNGTLTFSIWPICAGKI